MICVRHIKLIFENDSYLIAGLRFIIAIGKFSDFSLKKSLINE